MGCNVCVIWAITTGGGESTMGIISQVKQSI